MTSQTASSLLLSPHPTSFPASFAPLYEPNSGLYLFFFSHIFSAQATMLSRSSLSRNAPRAFAAGRRSMASAASPAFQYDVSEASGVKVANREVEGPTGTLALVAKAGSRYQPFPGFSDALDRFAFKVGPTPSIGSYQVYLVVLNIQFLNRLPSSGLPCGSPGRLSCWAVKSRRHTRAKTLSSGPSSSPRISPTSQSCWPRLLPSPSSQVSWSLSMNGGCYSAII